MAQNSVQIPEAYPSAGKGIVITIFIGNRQLGSSKVVADGVEIIRGQSINHQPIPANTKKLSVISYVTAVEPSKNLIVTYVLDGGPKGLQNFSGNAVAVNFGDTWEFDATFDLS
jgi:hypothetical protein